MKTIKRLSVVFALIVAATISSCGGSDDDAAPVVSIPANGTYINATADGAAFTTVIMGQSAGVALRSGTGANSVIQVSGSSVNLATFASTSIAINLVGINAPGTYNVGYSSGSVLAYVTNAQATSAIAYSTGLCSTGATGTVTISTLTTAKIEGTFSFTGKNDGCTVTKSVTAGQFRGVFN